jgi:hypothetical protein
MDNGLEGLVPGDALELIGPFVPFSLHGMEKPIFGIDDVRGMFAQFTDDAHGRAFLGPDSHQSAIFSQGGDNPASCTADPAYGSLLFCLSFWHCYSDIFPIKRVS